MRFNVKRKTLAYQIYNYCEPRAWDVTALDIAEEFDITHQQVNGILRAEGWSNRIRAGQREYSNSSAIGFDEFTLNLSI